MQLNLFTYTNSKTLHPNAYSPTQTKSPTLHTNTFSLPQGSGCIMWHYCISPEAMSVPWAVDMLGGWVQATKHLK